MKQLGIGLRNGVLASAPPSLRSDALVFFEQHCVALCRGSDINRVRMVYETLRDHLGNPSRDGPKIAAQLRDSAIKSLTTVIISLNLPRADPRLVKFHVELLYRLLDGTATATSSTTNSKSSSRAQPVPGTAVQDVLQDRRLLAAECLQMLETAHPTLLGADAPTFLAMAAREAIHPTPGFVHTQLASTVVSNLAAAYLHQQEEYSLSYEDDDTELSDVGTVVGEDDVVYSSCSDEEEEDGDEGQNVDSEEEDEEDRTEEVLVAAAEVLRLPTLLPRGIRGGGGAAMVYDDEDGLEVEYDGGAAVMYNDTTAAGGGASASAASPQTSSTDVDTDIVATTTKKKGRRTSGSTTKQQHLSGGGLRKGLKLRRGATPSPTATAAEQQHTIATDSEGSSPRGILAHAILSTATATASSAGGASKQSSRRSMLASVAEADELSAADASDTPLDSPSDRTGHNYNQQQQGRGSATATSRFAPASASTSSTPVQPSSLTFALRGRSATGTSAGASTNSLVSQSSVASSIPWTAASTPRSLPAEIVLLQCLPGNGSNVVLSKRFSVPMHIQIGDPGAAPRYIITAEAQTALQDAAQTFIGAMRRLDPGAVARMTKALPPILRAARPSSLLLWPLFERQLSTGSTPLLRAVLDLHDQLPELFEGRGPSLVEKVLCQVNDPSLSVDHRVVGASWVLRQHAQQRHSGGALLLADSWQQLLPLGGCKAEPPQLAAIKVKALGACLCAGVADEEVACRAVCGWEGFGGTSRHPPTEHQLRAFTYALRILHASAPPDGPAAHRTHACLATSILEAIVARPQLVPGVDAFLETCAEPFNSTFLRAANALFSAVDGQFEILCERPEDEPFQGTTQDVADRIKAAVISRSSSLSGLMRGLSFRLSFTKRTHSMAPALAAPSTAPTPTARGGLNGGIGGGTWTNQAPLTARTLSALVVGAPTPRGGGAGATTTGPLDVRALRSSISAAFQQDGATSARGHPHHPMGSTAVPPPPMSARSRSTIGEGVGMGVGDSAASTPMTTPRPTTRVAGGGGGDTAYNYGNNYGYSPFDTDTNGTATTTTTSPSIVIPVPLELPTQEAVESWLTSAATWEHLATGILRHDVLSYRVLLRRVVTALDVHPRGTLRTVANFMWQYKEHHPLHALSAKETGASVLAVCHAAALAHLPCGEGWTLRQSELAESVQNVLDALEEGFPVASVQGRCRVLSRVVGEEGAWGRGGGRLCETMRTLLDTYVEAGVRAV